MMMDDAARACENGDGDDDDDDAGLFMLVAFSISPKYDYDCVLHIPW
jgi:hypothetical protein